ncbi:hypothetical protein GGR53DRAFT_240774 [Hypoxylon sp. FL1150]|nr:hypothetical protein GGR53DRAFT_240774 [Hypoxylon sp. FL1150]
MPEPPNNKGFGGRVRSASTTLLNTNPQLGMWQATGTVIAQAPNLTELRMPDAAGGIEFNSKGHSARTAIREADGDLVPATLKTRLTLELSPPPESQGQPRRRSTFEELYREKPKEKIGPTILNGLKAFWKFFRTPSGFCIIIYFLNIVAWGAMLFFLLLKAAPAMNHPTADDDNSPRKKWLEIDSQILNALFCVTGFGLAPWRFRDFYFLVRAALFRDVSAMRRLAAQNKGWFRPPAWARGDEDTSNCQGQKDEHHAVGSTGKLAATFTGKVAPSTALWKLASTIFLMVLNTLFQVILCYYMWAYNRITRPTWATGAFIGLGCGVSALAGIISWYEGRRVKKNEGPELNIIDKV